MSLRGKLLDLQNLQYLIYLPFVYNPSITLGYVADVDEEPLPKGQECRVARSVLVMTPVWIPSRRRWGRFAIPTGAYQHLPDCRETPKVGG
jgi:hypothetical protein